MFFFILLFIVDIVFSILLVWLVLSSARRSLTHQVKRAVFYLLPVVATLVLLSYTLFFSAPRLLDVESMVLGTLPERTVTVERLGKLNTAYIDGERVYLAPWADKPVEGGVYDVVIAEHSRTVIKMEPFDAVSDDG